MSKDRRIQLEYGNRGEGKGTKVNEEVTCDRKNNGNAKKAALKGIDAIGFHVLHT